uniref:Ig-like domain-containing protein n=1 Tax=Syphacia muris TaxID=451379 RepID=A0A0N5AEP3_9BILA
MITVTIKKHLECLRTNIESELIYCSMESEEEEKQWTSVKTIKKSEMEQGSMQRLHVGETTSFTTNRESVFHRNVETLEERHLIKSTGVGNKAYSEEHSSSEIKSYTMAQPPKFIQVIKAFRVLATDTLTLVVEVASNPPAIFEWYCNDRPIKQDRFRYKIRHGINITTLTVEHPEQGVYKCTATNPAGVSTTYGYVTVSGKFEAQTLLYCDCIAEAPRYKTWTEQKSMTVTEEFEAIVEEGVEVVRIGSQPKFVTQVPNLTLKPGTEAVIDVEVSAFPPANFKWFVNGIAVHEAAGNFITYYPTPNRCVARFPFPRSGEYTVVAENSHGTDESIGYIKIIKEVIDYLRPPIPRESVRHHMQATELSPQKVVAEKSSDTRFESSSRASSITKYTSIYEQGSYSQRSASLPRSVRREKTFDFLQERMLHESNKGISGSTSMINSTLKETSSLSIGDRGQSSSRDEYRAQSESVRYIPQKPSFRNSIPRDISLSSNEKLIINVDVDAVPQAEIKWNLNGFELKSSETVSIHNERNHSALVIMPPVKEGTYTVSAVNEFGIEVLKTKVTRIDKFTGSSNTVAPARIAQQGQKATEITKNTVAVTTAEDEWLTVSSEDFYRSTESLETKTQFKEKYVTESDKREPRWETDTRQQRVTNGIPRQPKIVECPVKQIHIEKGKPLELRARIDANPPVLKSSRHVIIDEPLYNETRLVVMNPNSGYYRMTATNNLGSCSSTTRVVTTTVDENEAAAYLMSQKTVKSEREQQPKFTLTRKVVTETEENLPTAPKLVEKLPAVIRIKEGAPLSLTATVQAHPPAKFTWLFNNFELKQSNVVTIEDVRPNVSRVALLHPASGKYEAIAHNNLGRTSTFTKVYVERKTENTDVTNICQTTNADSPKPPVFTKLLPPEMVIQRNKSEFTLSVSYVSRLPITYQWFENGSLLLNTEKHQMTCENNRVSLIVRKRIIKPTVYEVKVTNSAGSVFSQTYVYEAEEKPVVVKKNKVGAPKFEKILKSIDVAKGSKIEIKVKLDSSSKPSKFRWFLNGLDLRTVQDCTIKDTEYESSLTISNVTLSTTGELCVVAKNQYGSALCAADVSLLKEETKFDVVQTPQSKTDEKPPRIVEPLRSQMFTEGDLNGTPLCIRCKIEAVPKASVVWKKDGVNVEEWGFRRDMSTRINSDGMVTLNIPNCVMTDSGIYQCCVQNIYGSAETAAYIGVEEGLRKEEEEEFRETTVQELVLLKPTFIQGMRVTAVRNEAKLVCQASNCQAIVRWLKDGIELHNSDKYTISSLPDGTQSLQIHSISVADIGLYVCRLENEIGTVETEANLKLEKSDSQTEVQEELLVEEQSDELIGSIPQLEYTKKTYTDVSTKIVKMEETDSTESYSKVAELNKAEEQYKLLVKVADIVARKLVANIVIEEAVREAVRRIDEEFLSEETETILYHQPILERHLPPKFKNDFQFCTMDAKNTVELVAEVTGVPRPTTNWYFGNEELTNNRRTKITNFEDRSTLQIKNISKADEGVYRCEASNVAGKSVFTCNLPGTSDFHVLRKISQPLKSTEAEMMSQIEIRRPRELFETLAVIFEPQMKKSGYVCKASTSEVQDDSVIVTPERICSYLNETVESYARLSAEIERDIDLNINIEKQEPHFTNVVKIYCTEDAHVCLFDKTPHLTRYEEVLQASNIEIVEKQRKEVGSFERINVTLILDGECESESSMAVIPLSQFTCNTASIFALQTIDIQRNVLHEFEDSVFSAKSERSAYVESFTEVRRPAPAFVHKITILEPEIVKLEMNLNAPKRSTENIITFDVQLHQNNTFENASAIRTSKSAQQATVYQKLFILEEPSKVIEEHITLNIKKSWFLVRKEVTTRGDVLCNTVTEIWKTPQSDEAFIVLNVVPKEFQRLSCWASESRDETMMTLVQLKKPSEIASQTATVNVESCFYDYLFLNVVRIGEPETIEYGDIVEKIVFYEEEKSDTSAFIEVEALSPDKAYGLNVTLSNPRSADARLWISTVEETRIMQTSASESSSLSNGTLLQAPYFVKKLEDVSVMLGETYQFKCIVTGVPAPDVKWYVDGDEIQNTEWKNGRIVKLFSAYETVYEDGVCILRIKQIILEDEGEYACEARNEAGKAFTKCFLNTNRKEFLERKRKLLKYSNYLSIRMSIKRCVFEKTAEAVEEISMRLKLHKKQAEAEDVVYMGFDGIQWIVVRNFNTDGQDLVTLKHFCLVEDMRYLTLSDVPRLSKFTVKKKGDEFSKLDEKILEESNDEITFFTMVNKKCPEESIRYCWPMFDSEVIISSFLAASKHECLEGDSTIPSI